MASGLARVFSGLVTNPIGVVRTRQEMLGFNGYSGLANGLLTVYRQEGIRKGLFQGGLTSSYINAPFAGLFFLFYIRLKDQLLLDSVSSGLIAGALATLLTNPLDLIRARL